MKTLPQPWTAAMEVTVFTGWIYDHLKRHAAGAEGRASVDAAGHRRSEEEERPHRRQQNLRLSVAGVLYGFHGHSRAAAHPALSQPCWSARWCRPKNKIAVPLMEAEVSYNKQRLHFISL